MTDVTIINLHDHIPVLAVCARHTFNDGIVLSSYSIKRRFITRVVTGSIIIGCPGVYKAPNH
jgi:hypothetical protein